MALASTKNYEREYQRLNPEQRQAVDTIEGPVMVLAGPGTGKTQVLAMRIATILLKTQMDPWNILCLTFTESGTAAMRSRLIKIIGRAGYYVRIHTFHSFCNDVIQDHPELFATAREWQVLSDVERVEVFREIIHDLPVKSPLKPFGDPYLYLRDIAATIDRLKQENIDSDTYQKTIDRLEVWQGALQQEMTTFFALPAGKRTEAAHDLFEHLKAIRDELSVEPALWVPIEKIYTTYSRNILAVEEKRDVGKLTTKFKNDLKRWFDRLQMHLPKQRAIKHMYDAYEQKLRQRGRYDFGDMIAQVINQFKSNKDLLSHYQEQFQYILVDEYQDTNSAQNETLKLLGSFYPNPNIFVVGDDKQSIFRFQGASLENLLFFYELYKEYVTVIPLRHSYRTHQVLLDAAQAVIDHNEESVKKYIPNVITNLQSAASLPSKPVIIQEFLSEDAEYYGVARHIQRLISDGVDPESIAVLYRYHRDVAEFQHILLKLDIPVRLEAGENILTDQCIDQFLILLRYIASVDRDDLLAKLMEHEVWQFSPLDVVRILHYAGTTYEDIFTVICSHEHLVAAGVSDPEQFHQWCKTLASWRQISENITVEQLFERVLQESGWLNLILSRSEKFPLLQKFKRLFEELKEISHADTPLTLSRFIAHIDILRGHELELPIEAWQTQSNAVRLMTAHKSKGLEFDYVFLIQVVDKHWGNVRERNRIPMPHGLLPHDTIAGRDNNEDERRLFYVALTRAKREAIISYATHRHDGKEQVPSLFIEEIPEQYSERSVVTEDMDGVGERMQTMAITPLPFVHAQDVQAWLKDVVSHHVLSFTHVNDYLRCPRMFYYRHILRVPAADTKYLAFGNAVHYALRDFVIELNTTKTLPNGAWLTDRFKTYLRRQSLTAFDRRDSVALGEEVLPKYYEAYHHSFKPGVISEYDFKNHGVVFEAIPLTGKIDKIEFLEPEKKGAKVNVVDYKTGNPDSVSKKLGPDGEYRRQLVFYKLLCDLSPQFEYEMVSGEIDCIQPSSKNNKFVKKKIEIGTKDIQTVSDTIKQVWKDMQELKFLDEGLGCGECEYCRSFQMI